MNSGASLSYASVSTTPRPPRVVIVIDGGPWWTYLARRALYRANRIWGGAGFAIVPHHAGKVHPALLRACQVYDPDYVLAYHPTYEDMEHFKPGWFQMPGDDGKPLEGEARQEMLDQVRDETIALTGDLKARDVIAAVCSTYQTSEHTEWHEAVEFLDADDSRHFTPAMDVAGAWAGSVLACPPGWGGLLGTAIASHAGIAAPPTHDRDEPEVSEDERAELTSWLLGADWATPPASVVWHPTATAAVGVDTRKTLTAHERTLAHLMQLASGHQFRQTGLWVFGDSADDFALARLWQLNFGVGHWLPSVLGTTTSPIPWPISSRIVRLQRELARSGGTLAITSTSVSKQDLEGLRGRIASSDGASMLTLSDDDANVVEVEDLPWEQHAVLGFAVKDQWDSVAAIPVNVDSAATVCMAAPLPPPVLTHPDLASLSEPTWHVDVYWRPGQSVRRRGIDSIELFAERPRMMPTWVRSSRDGITYQASRFDMVLAGTRQENRLARVALRDLSLDAWIKARGKQHGHDARPSDAGRRAALLASMLGGRSEYIELFGGALRPALRAMLPPKGASTTSAYADHQGVVLGPGEGVLSFTGVGARCLSLSSEELRARIDAACRAGVLRRGLVLRCSICEHLQFQPVDKLAQRWSCQRCDSPNDLEQQAWRAPHDEPTWFYDLHPVGRLLLRGNGDVPALLAAHLSRRPQSHSNHPQYSDVPEVVFSKAGQPVVELDLVTYANDKITVAECKKSGQVLENREGRREVSKKCQAALWLCADELLFATTDHTWTTASQSAIKTAVDSFPHWGPLGPPVVTLVSRLGTSHEKSFSVPRTIRTRT